MRKIKITLFALLLATNLMGTMMGTLTATASEQEPTPEKPYDDFDDPTYMYRDIADAGRRRGDAGRRRPHRGRIRRFY